MSIPKKGSRLITVDGTKYRWRVRHKPTYSQGNAWKSLTFSVQQVDSLGAVLIVEMPQAHPASWMSSVIVPVLPSDVERCLRYALATGWNPTQMGKTFRVDGAEVT